MCQKAAKGCADSINLGTVKGRYRASMWAVLGFYAVDDLGLPYNSARAYKANYQLCWDIKRFWSGVQVSLFVGNSLSNHGYVNRYDFEIPVGPTWPEGVLGRPTLTSRDYTTPANQGILQNFRYAAPGGMAYDALANELYIAKGGDTSGAPVRVVPGMDSRWDCS